MNVTIKTLGQICDEVGGIIRTGPFGSQLHESDYVSFGLPVIMPKNILDGKVDINDIAYISKADEERLKVHKLNKGDIVYGRRGDIGRRAYIGEKEQGWLCGTGCIRISLGREKLDPKFLYYYLGDEKVIGWIKNQAIGATLPNLNSSIIRRIEIRYPSLPIQQKIASILSAYDNLIENNTRRIRILEEMAQSIYREWFVHFCFPGHEGVRLVESPLGLIPEGWEVKPFSRLVEIDPTTPINKDVEKPFIEMSGLSTDSMNIEWNEWRTGASGSKFQNRDVLFPRITPSVENGKGGFVQCLPEGEKAVGSTEFIVFRQKFLPPEFIYFLTRDEKFRNHAAKSMIGASGRQRVQKSCFDNYFIFAPPQELLAVFQKQVVPFFELVHLLFQKNKNLRQQRDLLLPRLMSGELDVSELEMVEDPRF